MSNKTKEVTQRAGALVIGPRSGKSLTRAVWEMWGEFDSPPATPKEAEAFCRIHIKRCNMNLANAKDRGDKRAVINLERKLAVYEYLYNLVKGKAAEINSATECPHCRVHAVGTDGVCSCCGAIKAGTAPGAGDDLVSRKALLAEYDRVHVGPPGGARKLIETAPGIPAVDIPGWATEAAYKNGYKQGYEDGKAGVKK